MKKKPSLEEIYSSRVVLVIVLVLNGTAYFGISPHRDKQATTTTITKAATAKIIFIYFILFVFFFCVRTQYTRGPVHHLANGGSQLQSVEASRSLHKKIKAWLIITVISPTVVKSNLPSIYLQLYKKEAIYGASRSITRGNKAWISFRGQRQDQ